MIGGATGAHRHQVGRSLVEVMVAMVLGLVVLGSVLSTVSGTGDAARKTDDLTRLGDDGQLALSLLSAQLRMAGFSLPRTQSGWSGAAGHYAGAPVRACDNGFVAVGAAAADLSCGASGPAAVAIFYEADVNNTYPGTAGLATNCLGNQLAPAASALGGTYMLADNRFFIRTWPDTGNPALYCAGSSGGGFTSQPLVDNVEQLTLLWGVSEGGMDKLGRYSYGGDTVRYLSADALDTAYAGDPLRWSRVTSVRVCIVMRSAPGVLAQAVPHVGCDGISVWPAAAAERRLRRALHTTVQLRNRSFAP